MDHVVLSDARGPFIWNRMSTVYKNVDLITKSNQYLKSYIAIGQTCYIAS